MIYLDVTNKGNDLSLRGLETGTLTIQSETVQMLVVHETGHNIWAGRGLPQEWAAAQFHVFNIIERTQRGYLMRKVTEFPVKKRDGRLSEAERKVLLG